MKAQKGIVAKLIWSTNRFKIYEDEKTRRFSFWDRNEEIFEGESFDAAYSFSMKYRNELVEAE